MMIICIITSFLEVGGREQIDLRPSEGSVLTEVLLVTEIVDKLLPKVCSSLAASEYKKRRDDSQRM